MRILIVSNGAEWVRNKVPSLKSVFGELIEFAYLYGDYGNLLLQKEPGATVKTIYSAFFERFRDRDGTLVYTKMEGEDSIGYCRLISPAQMAVFDVLENDRAYVNGKDLGDAFTVWASHELCHLLYFKYGMTDNTHLHFYSGEPEKAFEELKKEYSRKKSILEQIVIALKQIIVLMQQQVTMVDKKAPEAPNVEKSKSELLAEEARTWLEHDASPLNRAPKEVSCAEGVVNIVNNIFPNTFSNTIVSTDVLYHSLKGSPKFRGSLDPVIGCIIISPRTDTVFGHVGIYTGADTVASNDSRDGIFKENYTRESWRNTFIKGRGLKGFFFIPV